MIRGWQKEREISFGWFKDFFLTRRYRTLPYRTLLWIGSIGYRYLIENR